MKYALVTGGTKGIGFSVVERLLDEDYFAYVNYSSDMESAHLARKRLEKYKDMMSLIQSDLSKRSDTLGMIQKIIGETPGIDCIVINAGTTSYERFGSITEEAWDRVMEVNLNAPFIITQGFSKHINVGGSIVFIGSKMGLVPHGTSLPYSVSKAGMMFMARCLAKEFAKLKVTCNAIAPGFVETTWHRNKEVDHRKRIEEKILLNRFATLQKLLM